MRKRECATACLVLRRLRLLVLLVQLGRRRVQRRERGVRLRRARGRVSGVPRERAKPRQLRARRACASSAAHSRGRCFLLSVSTSSSKE
jgi:hypothetical protein